MNAADVVAEVRVARQVELKYLILRARCEADSVCKPELARLSSREIADSLQAMRLLELAHTGAQLSRLMVEPPAGHAEPKPSRCPANSSAPGHASWPAWRPKPASQPGTASSCQRLGCRCCTAPQTITLGSTTMCAATPALVFGQTYVLPMRDRALRGEPVSYEVSGCADTPALLRSGDALYLMRARDGSATQSYGSHADFARRYAKPAVQGAAPSTAQPAAMRP